MAFAQGVDSEPNNTCNTAQDFGAINIPFIIDGKLEATTTDGNLTSDIDFFKFSGNPGSRLSVFLKGQGFGEFTLPSPLQGFFDSSCNLIKTPDFVTQSSLEFSIPSDGIFILAVTTVPDFGFVGTNEVGTYQMTISPDPIIGSISGQITDAVTGSPLRGDTSPFASIVLFRCDDTPESDPNCIFNSQLSFPPVDAEGRYYFDRDFLGQPLKVKRYKILASANQYEDFFSEPFQTIENENRIENIELQPLPVDFSNIIPCNNIPAEGGLAFIALGSPIVWRRDKT